MKNIANRILLGALLIAAASLTSCSTLPANTATGFNPLDTPGTAEPTAAELHQGNLAAITSNPAYPLD